MRFYYDEKVRKAEKILADNGIEKDEVATVLQAIGYALLDKDLYPPTTSITDIGWDWDMENLSDAIDVLPDVSATIELFKLNAAQVAEMDEDDILDACYDAIRRNRVTPEEVFGLPEEVVVPAEWDDQTIAEFLSDEFGFCITGYTRSEDKFT